MCVFASSISKTTWVRGLGFGDYEATSFYSHTVWYLRLKT